MTGHSGKKFVIGLTIAVLGIMCILAAGFRVWKNGYELRAARGREVAARIRELNHARPLKTPVWQWEETVDHTEAMLIAVTGSNLLAEPQLVELSERIDELVRESRDSPADAPELLHRFWEEVERRAGPVADIYGRPECIRQASK